MVVKPSDVFRLSLEVLYIETTTTQQGCLHKHYGTDWKRDPAFSSRFSSRSRDCVVDTAKQICCRTTGWLSFSPLLLLC